jgi:DNA-directed RNA polymerase alpha subunit
MTAIQFYPDKNEVCLCVQREVFGFSVSQAEILRDQLSNAIKQASQFIPPVLVSNPILEKSIDLFNDTRIIKRLKSIGINTISDLVQRNELELFRIDGFGRVCLDKVGAFVENNGLLLGVPIEKQPLLELRPN